MSTLSGRTMAAPALQGGPRTAGISTPVLVAIIDVAACMPGRLRAVAEELQGRAAGVVGREPEATRAVLAGINVQACCAPPLGCVELAGSSLRNAFRNAVRDGSLRVVGPRAIVAARILKVPGANRSLGLNHREEFGIHEPLPQPVLPLDGALIRKEWGAGQGVRTCVLLATPAASCDARGALDIAGRTAMLGGGVVLVVHPDAPNAQHAIELSHAAGGAWRLALDSRVDDPELLASAADVALVLDVPAATAPLLEPVAPGLPRMLGAFTRRITAAVPHGDSLGTQLAMRAGLQVVVANDTPAARVPGLVPAAHLFHPRRPNVAAQALHAILSAAPR